MQKDSASNYPKLYFHCTNFEKSILLPEMCAILGGRERGKHKARGKKGKHDRKRIRIRDTNVRKEMKENFYHGILLGLFAGMAGWKVKSNAEAGEGYSDITVEVEEKDIGILIELKYAEHADFDAGCTAALQQISDRNYEETLLDDGMQTIYKYGIACYKKRCKVVSGEACIK